MSKPQETKCFAIFCDTICQGLVPVGTITEEGKPAAWQTFDTEREAQLDILDDLEEHIRQFKDGEREYDEIVMPPDCCTLEVTLLPDGSLERLGKIFPPPSDV